MKQLVRVRVYVLFLVLSFLTGMAYGAIPAHERAALIALYNSTDGDNWSSNDGWKTPPLHTDGFAMPGTENSWFRITVEANTVTWVYLYHNNLVGVIPPELGKLVNRENLWLSSNDLTGSIPHQPTNLSNLKRGNSDLRWNVLYTENNTLRNFLNSRQKDGDWESTQTIKPSNPAAAGTGYSSIRVSRTPIVYTGDTGGYRVFYSKISGGPYTFFYTTADKTVSQMDVFGLNPGTTYYFVIQTRTDTHENNQNTVDSEYSDEDFAVTSPATTPTVTTAAVTDITAATALCGGNVTSNGGVPVTARGVCWSTSPNPTTADNFTNDGDRAEAFTTTITGLNENTAYYVRAYAVNTVGTAGTSFNI